ncbi:hypothetical protein M1373_01710, partial [Candidatus Marsarchaeota archaeon]|nr:hypothetical protein [Candidatus Marsarchaeota archaeon]
LNHIIATANATNATMPEYSFSAPALNRMAVFPFQFRPSNALRGEIMFTVTAGYGNSIMSKTISFNFSVQGSKPAVSSQTAAIEARIIPSSEYLAYNISNATAISVISETSHCSALNFWGDQLPIQDQCQNASWYFWQFSSGCYYSNAQVPTATYCLYSSPTHSSIASLVGAPRYVFNITVEINYSGAAMEAVLTNSSSKSELMLNGAEIGTVEMGHGIYGTSQLPPAALLLNKSGAYAIGYTPYSDYEGAQQQLSSVLSYYNNSDSGSAQASISKLMHYYNLSLASMAESASLANSTGCNMRKQGSTAYYYCEPSEPFQFYNISVTIFNYSGSLQELNYIGSEIRIN